MRFITSSKDYNKVYQNNRKFYGRFFNVLACNEPEIELISVGVVASRKVGNAVARNLVKRRVKAFLREQQVWLTGGKNIVVIAKQSASKADWSAISQDLTDLFKQALL